MGILTILKDLEILFAHLMLFTHLLPPLHYLMNSEPQDTQ